MSYRAVESAEVSPDATIGDHPSLWHLCQVREGAVLGESCVIGRGAYIGSGVRMGDNCKVQNHALVYEPAVLGDGVFIGPAVVLTNDTAPDFNRLPEADRADMETFIEQLRIILPLVGFDLFRPRRPVIATSVVPSSSNPVFAFSTGGASATAREIEDGFVVHAGSTAKAATSATFQAGYQALRERLLSDGSLIASPSPNLLAFGTDVIFSSPSAAAVAKASAMSPTRPAGTSTAVSAIVQCATGRSIRRFSSSGTSRCLLWTRSAFVMKRGSSPSSGPPMTVAMRRNWSSFPHATASEPSAQASSS